MALTCLHHVSHVMCTSCPVVASLTLRSSTHSCEFRQSKSICGVFPCIEPSSCSRRGMNVAVVQGAANPTASSDAFEDPTTSGSGTSPKQVGAQKVSNSNAHILVPPQCSLLQSLSQEEARSLILQSALLGIKEWKTARSEVHEVPTYSIQGPTSCASDVDHLLKKMPMPILYQLPRRRIRVAFTCTFCQQHNTRGINPRNYIDGTIFVQVSILFQLGYSMCRIRTQKGGLSLGIRA
ncbi:hypothetical protein BDL97_01G140100 [Sphagnum fallax]|nr:hypothetical protein BDL97_01G140100 [Sphagnum fallax]